MGLHPRFPVGTFLEEDTPTLLEFCNRKPDYHIINRLPCGVRHNKYMPGGRRYYLADGDDDLSLFLEISPEAIKEDQAELTVIIRRLMAK